MLSISLGYVIYKLWRSYTTSCGKPVPAYHAENRNPDYYRYGTALPATCMTFAVPALFSVLSRYESRPDYSANFMVLRLNRYRVCCMGTARVAQNPDAPGLIYGGRSGASFGKLFQSGLAVIPAMHSRYSSQTQRSFQLDTAVIPA